MAAIREAAAAAITGHAIFTAVGIGNAVVAGPPDAANHSDDLICLQPRCLAAAQVAAGLYSGGGLEGDICTEDVTFTDPAACCSGRAEVVEAFRALRWTRPEHITTPRASQADGALHVHLHQRYFSSPWWRGLEVKSTLVLKHAPDGQICELEERWNDAPLLRWRPFYWARRVNGRLSSLLTPLLLR
uniref:Uncharacterized protein n=1 Tax=Coccolithus braarudii TaxID=221442 RepID=A0A7S0KYL3_9EUKA